MNNFRSPKGFLMWGGIVLLVIGILGYIGIIGPTPERSIFGESWYFDNGENIAHSVLGIIALIAAFTLKDEKTQKTLVMLVGVLALVFTVLGFILPGEAPNLGVANLENPMDNILHLVVTVWAFWAATGKKMATGSTMPAM